MNFLKYLDEQNIVSDKPLLFIKFFSEEKHRQDFLNRMLYTSPLQRYVENEEERGLGRGDDLEGILSLTDLNIELRPTSSNTEFSTIPLGKGNLKLFSKEMLRIHCFCVTALYPEDFDVLKETANQVMVRCNISKNDLSQMGEEFGKFICVFDPTSFIESVNAYSINNDENVAHMRVDYLDYSVNPKIRVESFQNEKDLFFFQKSLFFKKEREYRFIFTNHFEKEASFVDLKETFGYSKTIKNVEDLIDDLPVEILSFTKNQQTL